MPRPQKKNAGSEYYDTTDPFIDDSELALDERQFFAQTKQQGFYVSSGEVALLKDKTPKKPKSKKISFAAGLHPSLNPGDGTRDAPIAIDADADAVPPPPGASASAVAPSQLLREGGVHLAADAAHVGQKRKRPGSAMTSIITENGKRKKVVDERMFHPDLQRGITELRVLVKQGKYHAHCPPPYVYSLSIVPITLVHCLPFRSTCHLIESWENKGKFPPSLKPALARLAILAIRLDEYDDDFFSLMPMIFPYNKFTMSVRHIFILPPL